MVQYITHRTNHLNTVLCINNNPEKCPFLVPVLLSVSMWNVRPTAPKPMSFLITKTPDEARPRRRQRARHENTSAVLLKDAAYHVLSCLCVWKQSAIFWDAFKGGNNVVQNQEPAWQNKHEAGKTNKCRETITYKTDNFWKRQATTNGCKITVYSVQDCQKSSTKNNYSSP